MQTDLQNDLSALNDRFSQMSTSEQYQQLHDQQSQLQHDVHALNTAFGDFRDHFHYKVLYQIQHLCIATLKIWLV
jgi:hypothetical protein